MKTIGKLEAMMAALDEINDSVMHDDEFTASDFVENAQKNGKIISYRAAKDNLSRLAEAGKLRMRKIVINGSLTNVYSAP